MRLCAGHPAQPSTLCMPSDGPPITQRTSGLGRSKSKVGLPLFIAHRWAHSPTSRHLARLKIPFSQAN